MCGRLHVLPTDGIRHVAHVEVSTRIHRDPVRGDELYGLFPFLRFAKARLQMSLQIVDAHAMPQTRGIVDPTMPFSSPIKKLPS